jgi:hypothetical protein
MRVSPLRYEGRFFYEGDCRVDLTDFAGFADNWLVDCDKNPNDFGCGVLR